MYLLALWCLALLRGCESAWTPLQNLPLTPVYPCGNSGDIAVWLEPGLSQDRNNRYYVLINKIVPANSVVNVTFDSVVNIVLTVQSDDTEFSRASLSDGDSFALRFDSELPSLSFIVEGATAGLPLLTGLSIDNEQFCEPDVGYLREYKAKGVLQKSEYPWKAVIRKSHVVCGRRHADDTRPTENGPAQPGAWPWHAAVYRMSRYQCGGTLISNDFVLTVAHCVVPFFSDEAVPEKFKVVLGQHSLHRSDYAHAQEKKIEKVIPHEHFIKINLFSDIALLKLSSPASLTRFVQPACLWRSGVESPPEPVVGVVAGWGYDNDDLLSGSLQQVTLPIVSVETCIRSHPNVFTSLLNSNNFCAGYHNNGTALCNGDSGGGLMVKGSGNRTVSGVWYVRGIVSASSVLRDKNICDPDQYTVFTDVAKFASWIDTQLEKW